jgi:dienelactone hydrolase
VRHLVAQRVADPRRIGILGGSYGGYATLAGVAFTPALYAAAVSIVGPSNLITLLDSIPPYWEAVRTLFHERMGDPSTPEGRERLDRQSPLNSAANIRTPLMVIQGANDPRVKKRESDQIVVALRDRGFPVEYIVAPDEGHGFARPENSLATFAAAEAFLAKYLNGRFQESMTPELAAHLKELTVDPRALGVAGSPTRPIAPTKAPAPGVPLVAGTWTYGARIGGGAGSTEVVVTTEVREAPEGWLLTSSVTTPGGEVTERAVLDRALVVKRRTVVQGPLAFDVEVQGGRATGRLTVAGRTYPIAAELGGELFADGTAAYQVIATLPLAPGYTATFRNFDVQAQKERVVSLEVAGRETVTVPAGTFDALKVELTTGDDDRTTVWVDAESRTVAKVAGAWPQMPGATIAAELQQQRLAGPRRP